MKSYQSKKTVFTLIELLVKIAIIAIFVHNSIKAVFGVNLSGFCFVFSVKKTVVLPSSLTIMSLFLYFKVMESKKIEKYSAISNKASVVPVLIYHRQS